MTFFACSDPKIPIGPLTFFWAPTPPAGQPDHSTGRYPRPRLQLRVRVACLHNGKGRWPLRLWHFLARGTKWVYKGRCVIRSSHLHAACAAATLAEAAGQPLSRRQAGSALVFLRALEAALK